MTEKVSRVPVLLYAGEVSRDGYYKLTDLCKKLGFYKHAILVMATYGGDPHAGYRIGRCLQHHFESFTIVIPDHCKSAGTLIAMAANDIVMCDRAELGPLDVQVLKNHELFERGSGLDLPQSIQALKAQALAAFKDSLIDMRMGGRLSTKIAGELAAKLTTGMFSPIFAQIDPLRLGEHRRANNIGHEYGRRLAEKHGNLTTETIAKLIASYPSHSFVIDRKEASALFKNVRGPSEMEEAFLERTYPLIQVMLESAPPVVEDITAHYYGDDNAADAIDHVSDAEGSGAGPEGGGSEVDGSGEGKMARKPSKPRSSAPRDREHSPADGALTP